MVHSLQHQYRGRPLPVFAPLVLLRSCYHIHPYIINHHRTLAVLGSHRRCGRRRFVEVKALWRLSATPRIDKSIVEAMSHNIVEVWLVQGVALGWCKGWCLAGAHYSTAVYDMWDTMFGLRVGDQLERPKSASLGVDDGAHGPRRPHPRQYYQGGKPAISHAKDR